MEMYNYDSLAEAIKQPISSEARFYTVEDIVKMTGWSHNTVLKLFNDPQFPAADFGRAKTAEGERDVPMSVKLEKSTFVYL